MLAPHPVRPRWLRLVAIAHPAMMRISTPSVRSKNRWLDEKVLWPRASLSITIEGDYRVISREMGLPDHAPGQVSESRQSKIEIAPRKITNFRVPVHPADQRARPIRASACIPFGVAVNGVGGVRSRVQEAEKKWWNGKKWAASTGSTKPMGGRAINLGRWTQNNGAAFNPVGALSLSRNSRTGLPEQNSSAATRSQRIVGWGGGRISDLRAPPF